MTTERPTPTHRRVAQVLRASAVFLILFGLKVVARAFWRLRQDWVGEAAGTTWSDHQLERVHIVAILNHTSLYELLYAGMCPNRFLWRIAANGVLPAADKTISRPLVGLLFRFIARDVVSISRQRDHTWREVLRRIGSHSMVLILPEGRMKRPNGLDLQGQPLTVRGGIADLLAATPDGLMLLAYSGGLHHVQAPGETIPRFFRPVRMNFEMLDIERYRTSLGGPGEGAAAEANFKRAVIEDLQARRARFCPPDEPLPASVRRRFGLDTNATDAPPASQADG